MDLLARDADKSVFLKKQKKLKKIRKMTLHMRKNA